MKNFSGRVALCAICYFLSSCTSMDDPFGFRDVMGGIRDNFSADSSGIDKTIPGIKSVYVSGIDIQDSSIVLFKNGERILSIPYGNGSRVSPDPDMHHIIDGNLYTEFHDDSGTTITKNGVELFSYEEKETLKGLLVDKNDVYTLGKKCSRGGFTFRKNGITLLDSPSGQIFGSMYDASYLRTGALYKDRGAIYFSYFSDKWHLVMNGEDNVLPIPLDVTDIYDIRIVDGAVCYVCEENYSTAPMLCIGQERFYFKTSGLTSGKDFRLYPRNNGIFFCGSVIKGSTEFYSIWTIDGESRVFQALGCTMYRDDDSYAYTQSVSGSVQLYTGSRGLEKLSGSYEFLSCWNADYSEGVFRVALNPTDKNHKPFLWENGKITDYDIQGSLVSVYYGL